MEKGDFKVLRCKMILSFKKLLRKFLTNISEITFVYFTFTHIYCKFCNTSEKQSNSTQWKIKGAKSIKPNTYKIYNSSTDARLKKTNKFEGSLVNFKINLRYSVYSRSSTKYHTYQIAYKSLF